MKHWFQSLTAYVESLNWGDDIASSIIGTVMAVFFISMLGERLSKRWADREFERRWKSYRTVAARNIFLLAARLYPSVIDLGSCMQIICLKDHKTIDRFDYQTFREKRKTAEDNFRAMDEVISTYHYCLRSCDIDAIQILLISLQTIVKSKYDNCALSLNLFESSINYIAQGIQTPEAVRLGVTVSEELRRSSKNFESTFDQWNKDWYEAVSRLNDSLLK